ncbi:MAG: hypothetical protein ACYDCC_14100 [Actinomycetota bacterium]
MRKILPLVLLLALGSCSGSSHLKPHSKGSVKQAGIEASQAVLPKSLPPAAIFLGPNAWRTSPSEFCLQGSCRALTPQSARLIEGATGSPVFFSVSAPPLSAHLLIRSEGSAQSSTAPLEPGTAMVWQASVAPGAYSLELVANYATTQVTWPFALRLSSPSSG